MDYGVDGDMDIKLDLSMSSPVVSFTDVYKLQGSEDVKVNQDFNGSFQYDGEEDLSNGPDSEDSGEAANGEFLVNGFSNNSDGSAEQRKLCLVCSDVASGLHYGVASCEACKAFFKRTVQGNIEYSCPANGMCEITKRRRKACQACRYQKCLIMGMLKEGVRVDRVRGGRQKYKRSTESAVLSVAHSPQLKRPTTHIENKMIAALLTIEPEKVFARPNDTLADDEYKLMLTLSDLADRELVATIGWAKQVPGFINLHLPDQMNLLQSTWLEIVLFNLSFRSTPYTGIMVYADDFKCSIDDSSKFGTPTEFDLVSRRLSKKMSDLAVTKEEYVLLKTMLLLNPDVNVKNPEMVQQLRERMQDALLEYETARGQLSHRRMCSLMFLFPILMHEKILAREFWLNVKKSGRVVLHKLLSEMLDFIYT